MILEPQVRMDSFYRAPPTSPEEPQNLLRPTNKGCMSCAALNGLGKLRGGGLRGLGAIGEPGGMGYAIYSVIGIASTALSAYHGYKRNNSVWGGVLWGFFGAVFPVITPVVALAQGYGKRKGR
jgi:hypothetical protein